MNKTPHEFLLELMKDNPLNNFEKRDNIYFRRGGNEHIYKLEVTNEDEKGKNNWLLLYESDI